MRASLRFCMITTFYPPYHFGGDGEFIYRLSNELARRGHAVDVIFCKDAYHLSHPEKPADTYPNHSNVSLHGLGSKAGALSPLLSQQTGHPGLKNRTIKRILERGQFDVIHFHNISLIGGPDVLRLGRAVKLYTLHEYWLVCPTHVLFKYNREACTSPTCLRCTLSYGQPPQLWRHTGKLRRAVEHVDRFISPSRFVGDQHRRMGLDISTTHIPMFVSEAITEIQAAANHEDNSNNTKPYFLFVGRLEKLKGLQDVIPLFADYTSADLVIAGEGAYLDELKMLAKGSKNVKFIGKVSLPRLSVLYRSAIALLVPSLCYETFGMIILEAFAQKTPVIGRDIGAVKELIEDSGGGFTFINATDLREKMNRLHENPNLRAELGNNGYTMYQSVGTAEAHIRSYMAVIREIIDAR